MPAPHSGAHSLARVSPAVAGCGKPPFSGGSEPGPAAGQCCKVHRPRSGLPEEILADIFEQLEAVEWNPYYHFCGWTSRQDLVSLSLVCRRFASLARPLLYRNLLRYGFPAGARRGPIQLVKRPTDNLQGVYQCVQSIELHDFTLGSTLGDLVNLRRIHFRSDKPGEIADRLVMREACGALKHLVEIVIGKGELKTPVELLEVLPPVFAGALGLRRLFDIGVSGDYDLRRPLVFPSGLREFTMSSCWISEARPASFGRAGLNTLQRITVRGGLGDNLADAITAAHSHSVTEIAYNGDDQGYMDSLPRAFRQLAHVSTIHLDFRNSHMPWRRIKESLPAQATHLHVALREWHGVHNLKSEILEALPLLESLRFEVGTPGLLWDTDTYNRYYGGARSHYVWDEIKHLDAYCSARGIRTEPCDLFQLYHCKVEELRPAPAVGYCHDDSARPSVSWQL